MSECGTAAAACPRRAALVARADLDAAGKAARPDRIQPTRRRRRAGLVGLGRARRGPSAPIRARERRAGPARGGAAGPWGVRQAEAGRPFPGPYLAPRGGCRSGDEASRGGDSRPGSSRFVPLNAVPDRRRRVNGTEGGRFRGQGTALPFPAQPGQNRPPPPQLAGLGPASWVRFPRGCGSLLAPLPERRQQAWPTRDTRRARARRGRPGS